MYVTTAQSPQPDPDSFPVHWSNNETKKAKEEQPIPIQALAQTVPSFPITNSNDLTIRYIQGSPVRNLKVFKAHLPEELYKVCNKLVFFNRVHTKLIANEIIEIWMREIPKFGCIVFGLREREEKADSYIGVFFREKKWCSLNWITQQNGSKFPSLKRESPFQTIITENLVIEFIKSMKVVRVQAD
jgi:hypothetical protein